MRYVLKKAQFKTYGDVHNIGDHYYYQQTNHFYYEFFVLLTALSKNASVRRAQYSIRENKCILWSNPGNHSFLFFPTDDIIDSSSDDSD